METLQIIKQLLDGNHLSPAELQKADQIVQMLSAMVKYRKPRTTDFIRIDNDVNGNPRYVCHYLEIAGDYKRAVQLAKSIGGRKYNTKSYGGGIVFQSYNVKDLERQIIELGET